MAITINELENGMGLVVDGQLFFVTELNHVKPGKGSAFVRVRLKNIRKIGRASCRERVCLYV